MQPKHEVPNYVGVQLCVQGYAVPKPRSYNYIRKSVSNTSNPAAESTVDIPASHSPSSAQQVAADSKFTEDLTSKSSRNSKREMSDPKITYNSSSSSNSVPSSPLRTGQTSLSCGTDASRSCPGTCASIVEINCKLPNTNLRVS